METYAVVKCNDCGYFDIVPPQDRREEWACCYCSHFLFEIIKTGFPDRHSAYRYFANIQAGKD